MTMKKKLENIRYDLYSKIEGINSNNNNNNNNNNKQVILMLK